VLTADRTLLKKAKSIKRTFVRSYAKIWTVLYKAIFSFHKLCL